MYRIVASSMILLLASCGSAIEEGALRAVIAGESGQSDPSKITYIASEFDLNSDGENEIIAYVTGQARCGTSGCPTYVISRRGGNYAVISTIAMGWPPIGVLSTKTNGWNDLSVHMDGGGIETGYNARLMFDGSRYPENPSVQPKQATTQTPIEVVISMQELEQSWRAAR